MLRSGRCLFIREYFPFSWTQTVVMPLANLCLVFRQWWDSEGDIRFTIELPTPQKTYEIYESGGAEKAEQHWQQDPLVQALKRLVRTQEIRPSCGRRDSNSDP